MSAALALPPDDPAAENLVQSVRFVVQSVFQYAVRGEELVHDMTERFENVLRRVLHEKEEQDQLAVWFPVNDRIWS